MNIRKHDVGSQRWRLTAETDDLNEERAFIAWMKINFPDCMCARTAKSLIKWEWEIRGRDRQQMMLILMTWS